MHTSEPNSPPLAIVGLGCLFPKAAGPGLYWAQRQARRGRHHRRAGDALNPDDYFHADPKQPDMTYARRGGFLSAVEFNPLEFGIAPRDIEATDTTQLLGLVAAKQALTDAGVRLKNPPPQPPSLQGGGSPNSGSPLP
jgi:acyl transferase domain-containing protein